MRLPFDLLAALMAVEAMRQAAAEQFPQIRSRQEAIRLGLQGSSSAEAFCALLAFWALAWLAHEGVARMTGWRTRWGRLPAGVPDASGRPPARHPLEFHARGVLAAQVFTVALFVLFLWHYRWTLKTCAWPEWFGLGFLPATVRDRLGDSSFFGGFMDLGPFLVAMLLGWLPKRRLRSSAARRRVPFWTWLSFEARLTLLPFVLWIVLYFFSDLAAWGWPGGFEGWPERPWVGLAGSLALLVFFALVAMPWIVVRFWQCRPLPDGALKERLMALMERSGVRARAILTWGPRNSGLANACVLGPWARMRYILISPGLAECLDPDECEAVLAHELGHARHGHLWMLVVLIVALAAGSELLLRLAGDWSRLEQSALFLALVVIYIRVCFGALSRACEREADLASAELVGSPDPLISALEKVGLLAGGIREIYSWHHDSIAKRVERLKRDGLDRTFAARYHERLRRWRAALGLCAMLAVAAVLFFSRTG